MIKCLSANVNNKIEQTSPVQDHTTMVKLTRWISEPSNIFFIHWRRNISLIDNKRQKTYEINSFEIEGLKLFIQKNMAMFKFNHAGYSAYILN